MTEKKTAIIDANLVRSALEKLEQLRGLEVTVEEAVALWAWEQSGSPDLPPKEERL